VINGYLSNVAADSGKPTNVFSVATQYTDASGNHIRYNLSENAPIVDATAPTAGGCTPDGGGLHPRQRANLRGQLQLHRVH